MFYFNWFIKCLFFIYLFLIEVVIFVPFLLLLNKKKKKFVVCGQEIATNIQTIQNLLIDSYSVCFFYHRFHQYKYDFGPFKKLVFAFYGPVLLVFLSKLSKVFIYNWVTGFCLDREIDFLYLKWKNRKVVSIHCGEDIRSLELTSQHYNSLKWHDHSQYRWQNKYFIRDKNQYENMKIKNAKISNKYSDLIFSKKVDMKSYLRDDTYPFFYVIDPKKYFFDEYKFLNIRRIRLLHAPSSPSNKGTPIVRAAVKKLEMEGYDFDYIELIGMPHEKIVKELSKSHIVLNQFYSFCYGTFGVEAMITKNCMLTSADPDINFELPSISRGAWVVTKYWEVYDKLKYLLENPDVAKKVAEKGYEYSIKFFPTEIVRERILGIFEQEDI